MIMTQLNPDIRKWYYFPIVMPISKDGRGPASEESGDIWKIKWEVWNQDLESLSSHDFLPEAINRAMRLELARINAKSIVPAHGDHRPSGFRDWDYDKCQLFMDVWGRNEEGHGEQAALSLACEQFEVNYMDTEWIEIVEKLADRQLNNMEASHGKDPT